jgi:hypothetical protein
VSYAVVIVKRVHFVVDAPSAEEARALAITAAQGELQGAVQRRRVRTVAATVAVEACEADEPPLG